MAKSINAILVALAAVVLVPAASYAAGLGTITVRSALGQPLDAEIEVVSAQPGEDIQVRLASREAYQSAGIDPSPALQGARFAIERRDGRTIIRVRTSQPVNDPFFSLLVELQSPTGRLSRQYTVLVDPAEYRVASAPSPQQAAAAAPPAAVSPAPAAAPARAQAQAPKVVASKAPTPAPAAPAPVVVAPPAPVAPAVAPAQAPAPVVVAAPAPVAVAAPAPAPVARAAAPVQAPAPVVAAAPAPVVVAPPAHVAPVAAPVQAPAPVVAAAPVPALAPAQTAAEVAREPAPVPAAAAQPLVVAQPAVAPAPVQPIAAPASRTATPQAAIPAAPAPQPSQPAVASAPVAQVATPAAPATPATVPAQQNTEVSDAYRIRRGDTLGAIARKWKPEGVSYEQMLVGLFETNRPVFIRDNINLIRAGATLFIPSRDDVLAISAADATRQVRTHMAAFAKYRDTTVSAGAGSGRISQAQREAIGSRRVGAAKKSTRAM